MKINIYLIILLLVILLLILYFSSKDFFLNYIEKIKDINQVPVVIIHFNNPDYLETCISCALKNNKIVYLIGDDTNKILSTKYNIKYIHKDLLEFDNFNECAKYYKHISPNNYNYELICFQRVFYLSNLMKKEKLNNCFHLDSDCLLLTNVSNFKIFKENDAAYIIKGKFAASIHNAYLTNIFCKKYIELYLDIYKNKKFNLIQEKIDQHYINGKYINGGICDMTLYGLLNFQNNIKILNLLIPIKDNDNNEFIFFNHLKDNTGEHKNEYRKKNNIVEIIEENNKKYVFSNIKNKKLLAAAIHYQGTCKKLIKN